MAYAFIDLLLFFYLSGHWSRTFTHHIVLSTNNIGYNRHIGKVRCKITVPSLSVNCSNTMYRSSFDVVEKLVEIPAQDMHSLQARKMLSPGMPNSTSAKT